MQQMTPLNFSVKRVNKQLVEEIVQALKSVEGYGSIEIIIQENRVTQISTRSIRKTNHNMSGVSMGS